MTSIYSYFHPRVRILNRLMADELLLTEEHPQNKATIDLGMRMRAPSGPLLEAELVLWDEPNARLRRRTP